ncbi:hypothetical protein MNBD_GAMMA07-2275 [hydrothermal vent metagenome]|uniref:Phosphohistidine phosphatase SixA n=1 Tax=hydrothermal vent metagenome TaxID=652676 RepID=A0A3B0WNN9_9ZZZZ
MKIILFARHAKSDINHIGASDFDRTLSLKGESDAVFMAKILQKSTYLIQQIISSDASRAIATADKYKNALTPDKNIQLDHSLYLASHQDIATVIENTDDALSCLMMVGHNPGMTEIVEYSINESFQGMPTCSVAVVGFEAGSWQEITMGSGQLLDFEYPKKHT